MAVIVFRVVGLTAKRQKSVRWEMSEKMADRVKEVFQNNDMQVDIFEHDVPTKNKGEFLEWLNTHAV